MIILSQFIGNTEQTQINSAYNFQMERGSIFCPTNNIKSLITI
nr:MAG TPA: hypothetical protein [Caudoviricetes sp.]